MKGEYEFMGLIGSKLKSNGIGKEFQETLESRILPFAFEQKLPEKGASQIFASILDKKIGKMMEPHSPTPKKPKTKRK